MTCRELSGFLDEYLAGNLAPEERAPFETHLAECPDCVTYLRSYADTIQLGKDACRDPDDPVPPAVPDALVQAIVAARGRSPRQGGNQ